MSILARSENQVQQPARPPSLWRLLRSIELYHRLRIEQPDLTKEDAWTLAKLRWWKEIL